MWWMIAWGCSESPCAERAADACGEGCATIDARPVVDGCVQAAAAPVGCQDLDLGCDDVLTLADDPDGARWWFSDACVPAGFTPVSWTELPDC